MQLPLHKILLANGYRIDRNKSSMNYPCLTNDNGEHIIVSKKENNYLYFNPQNDTDRGNIISFCKFRNININDLIKNFDNNIEVNNTNDFFLQKRELDSYARD